MSIRLAASITALSLVVAGCSSGVASVSSATTPAADQAASGARTTAKPVNLTVCGASSLKAALARVKATYEAADPIVTLTISTDSSSALETKIEQGAPADVFLSADTANPQKLVDKGLAEGGLTKFAGNLLTVIVPKSNPAGIQTPADLARSGIKVIAASDTAPITKYTNQLVANLATRPGYPADFVAKYTANIVSKQDNVSAVVSQIALGEGDAGIVYVTDAKTATQITTIPVPTAANVPATYAGVVVKSSANLAAAQEFLTWLAGPDGQPVLAAFGFQPVP